MKKVLIIEDDDVIRNNTAEMLELSGYKAIKAENGKIGVKLALKEIPDIIISDIAMPVMDGFEVLYLLGKNPSTADIPFVFLTARTEKADMRKGMNMGADDYIFKPFEEMELLEAVEMRLKKNEHFKKEYTRDVTGLNEFFTSAKGMEELSKLTAAKKVRRVRKKEMIYLEGDESNNVVFINKGKVKIFNMNKEGKELITGMSGAGEFIGHLDLLESKLYRDSAVAMEDCEIVLIPKPEFYSLIYSSRDVAIRFINLLSNNIYDMKERLLALAYDSVRKRLAESLVTLQKKQGGEGKSTLVAISRENLASMVGITPESLSRTLRDFKDEKLIDLKGKQIAILNKDKLVNMKN